MATNLIFDMVKPDDVDYLRECTTKRELWETLSTIFMTHLEEQLLHKHPEEKKQGLREVFLDFMSQVTAKYLTFLSESEKISVALQVTFETFADSFVHHKSKKDSLELMSSILNRHCQADPPIRFLVFTIDDIKHISVVLIDSFFASYDLYYGLFATLLVSNFTWGPMSFGRFPLLLPLDYGTRITNPIEDHAIKQLYFSKPGDEELDELELQELMRGSLR